MTAKTVPPKNAARLAALAKAIREHRTRIKVGVERGNWAACKLDAQAIVRLANEALDLMG